MSRRLLPEGGSQNTDTSEERTPRDPKEEKLDAIKQKELMKAEEEARREERKEWREKRREGKKRQESMKKAEAADRKQENLENILDWPEEKLLTKKDAEFLLLHYSDKNDDGENFVTAKQVQQINAYLFKAYDLGSLDPQLTIDSMKIGLDPRNGCGIVITSSGKAVFVDFGWDEHYGIPKKAVLDLKYGTADIARIR